jgi:hypothetical protein
MGKEVKIKVRGERKWIDMKIMDVGLLHLFYPGPTANTNKEIRRVAIKNIEQIHYHQEMILLPPFPEHQVVE